MHIPNPLASKLPKVSLARKIVSIAGPVVAILLTLLLGLAFVVRSLKNIKLSLHLRLKRKDPDE